jgi:hypothetical protein
MVPVEPGGGSVKKVLVILAVLSLGVAALALIRSRRSAES